MNETVQFLRDEARQAEADGCPVEAEKWMQAATDFEYLKRWVDEVAKVANAAFDLDSCCHWESVCDGIERLKTILSTPPTWLCADCRNQWIMRDEAEKQVETKDNRDAAPLPPKKGDDGRLKCPGKDCAGIINKITPERCPNCLQPLEKTK